MARTRTTEEEQKDSGLGLQDYGTSALGGALAGATAGSAIPGIGTGIGAIGGAALGLGDAFFQDKQLQAAAEQQAALQSELDSAGADIESFRQDSVLASALQGERAAQDASYAANRAGLNPFAAQQLQSAVASDAQLNTLQTQGRDIQAAQGATRDAQQAILDQYQAAQSLQNNARPDSVSTVFGQAAQAAALAGAIKGQPAGKAVRADEAPTSATGLDTSFAQAPDNSAYRQALVDAASESEGGFQNRIAPYMGEVDQPRISGLEGAIAGPLPAPQPLSGAPAPSGTAQQAGSIVGDSAAPVVEPSTGADPGRLSDTELLSTLDVNSPTRLSANVLAPTTASGAPTVAGRTDGQVADVNPAAVPAAPNAPAGRPAGSVQQAIAGLAYDAFTDPASSEADARVAAGLPKVAGKRANQVGAAASDAAQAYADRPVSAGSDAGTVGTAAANAGRAVVGAAPPYSQVSDAVSNAATGAAQVYADRPFSLGSDAGTVGTAAENAGRAIIGAAPPYSDVRDSVSGAYSNRPVSAGSDAQAVGSAASTAGRAIIDAAPPYSDVREAIADPSRAVDSLPKQAGRAINDGVETANVGVPSLTPDQDYVLESMIRSPQSDRASNRATLMSLGIPEGRAQNLSVLLDRAKQGDQAAIDQLLQIAGRQ